MRALLEATKSPDYPAEIVLVVSDQIDAGGLDTALAEDIASFALIRDDFESKNAHEAAIIEVIESAEIDLICLAGYMRLLSATFTERFSGKLINIHPSLLPLHKGLDTHRRALEASDKEHGCTIHYVNAEMDGGTIIAQARVPVMEDDTPETLAARVLIEEHRLYPEVVKQLCSV